MVTSLLCGLMGLILLICTGYMWFSTDIGIRLSFEEACIKGLFYTTMSMMASYVAFLLSLVSAFVSKSD
jgi:hypothetical protein